MGCSIHTILQKKDDNGDYQTIIKGFNTDQNYELFGVFSEVRQDTAPALEEPIMEYGLPRDLNITEDSGVIDGFHIDGYFMGDHSFGYVTGDRIKELYQRMDPALDDCIIVEMRSKSIFIEHAGFQDSLDRVAHEWLSAMVTLFGSDIYDYRIIVGYDS